MTRSRRESDEKPVNVVCPHDARTPIPGVPAGSQSLVVTSPPYFNAVDYPRAHRLSVCWMNGHSPPDLVSRRSYIGLRHVKADDRRGLKQEFLFDRQPVNARCQHRLHRCRHLHVTDAAGGSISAWLADEPSLSARGCAWTRLRSRYPSGEGSTGSAPKISEGSFPMRAIVSRKSSRFASRAAERSR